jgi:hypothetical protein
VGSLKRGLTPSGILIEKAQRKCPVRASNLKRHQWVRLCVTALTVATLLYTSASVQTPVAKTKKDSPKGPLPQFEIALVEDASYPTPNWPERWMQGTSVESYCIGDGNVYVLKPALGLVGLTPNGIVSFLGDKMPDIPSPNTTYGGLNPSISLSGISFRVIGIHDAKAENKTWTDDGGHTHTEKDVTNTTLPYIARFGRDGTHKGAIKLDLPFIVSKFAAFNSGNLIAQGPDQNNVPRIALLDASAQFLRYLDLPKDISTSRAVSSEDIKSDGCTADMGSVVFNGYFTLSGGGNILFKREFTGGARVYEIQESGESAWSISRRRPATKLVNSFRRTGIGFCDSTSRMQKEFGQMDSIHF